MELSKKSTSYTFILIFLLCIPFALFSQITDYKVFLGYSTYKERDFIIIRSYSQQNNKYFIAIDVNNLETNTLTEAVAHVYPLDWGGLSAKYSNSVYIKALNAAKTKDINLQNAGIIHGSSAEDGFPLTVDLCPSHKPLDKNLVNKLIQGLDKFEKPIPISFSITGLFFNTHLQYIHWLEELVNKNILNITWINHTYNHHYDPKIPLNKNFLLEPNTDLNFEILAVEKLLIENHLTISPFFRFPGLVSDRKLVDQVINFGLIPIGSDAWLAKGLKAQNGDIVLIHGNGNEPLGVNDFLKILSQENDAIKNNKWKLFDLKESIRSEYQSSK